jgi:Domain of unknown function (DUF4129)
MQLEGLTIALRARTPWEAVDLGMALVRAYAARIWSAWVLVTLPTFVLLNILGWLIDAPWLAALALWWLKPVFDRIPMYVISRAVFGAVPSLRETLAAQRNWGWRGVWRWMHWRRLLHPGRAMLLSVDLLEGAGGAQRRERVRVLSQANVSPNTMLTILGINMEIMLGISIVVLGLMFVPVEFLSDSAKAVWRVLFEAPPLWAQILANLIGWITLTIVEPFYVGAGFGLYLNRRMQLEGWDIELAFRHLAARLSQPLMAAALLFLAVAAFSMPLRAEEAATQDSTTPAHPAQSSDASDNSKDNAQSIDDAIEHGDKKDAKDKHRQTTLEKMFAGSYRDDGAAFEAAVKKTYSEGELKSTGREFVWKRRHRLDDDNKKPDTPWWARGIGQTLGFIAEYGLWILLAIALVFIIANRHRWLPWISDRYAPARLPDRIDVHDVATAEPLPDDLPAAVRALLQRGQLRAAMALLYRAGVERLATSLGTPLPAGATESECLRRSRRLSDTEYAALFARIVRNWQAAAYAQRAPTAVEVEALLAAWSTPVQAPP